MLIETYLLYITDLGNVVVVGALAATVAVYLIMAGSHRPALALVVTFALAAVLIAVAKLICMTCHVTTFYPTLRSPSGHVAMTTAVYGMTASIVAARMKRWQGVLLWIVAIFLILLIAASRVLLGFHSPLEALAGLAIGGASYAVARWSVLRHAPVQFDGRALAVTAVAVILLFHGVPVPTEHMIQWLAMHIRPHVTVC
jgi:membrane-associated phospholipid phosphatase